MLPERNMTNFSAKSNGHKKGANTMTPCMCNWWFVMSGVGCLFCMTFDGMNPLWCLAAIGCLALSKYLND